MTKKQDEVRALKIRCCECGAYAVGFFNAKPYCKKHYPTKRRARRNK
jgi:hypothetical protein